LIDLYLYIFKAILVKKLPAIAEHIKRLDIDD